MGRGVEESRKGKLWEECKIKKIKIKAGEMAQWLKEKN